MELEKKKNELAEKGFAIIGISYDPVPTLADFAEKHNITYPLLSDRDSRVIKAFGIFNTSVEPGAREYGIPYPGIYIIDSNLKVVSKQFEETYYERPSGNTILTEHFEDLAAERTKTISTPYLDGLISLSDSTAYPAQILAFSIQIKMKGGFHLYGRPIAEDYVPFALVFDESRDFRLDPFELPQTTPMTLPGLDETFHILPESFYVTGHIRIVKQPGLGEKVINGTIKLQACNDEVCFPPEEIKFSFPLVISKKY